MRESIFRSRLAAHMRKHGAHVQTIETSTGNGVPDLELCWRGQTGWCELKVMDWGKPLTIRPAQWVWYNNRRKAGGRIALLAFKEDGRKLIRGIVPENLSELESSGGEEPVYYIPTLAAPYYCWTKHGVLTFMKDFLL